ncbi:integrase family protein [Hydrogenophaga sp. 5NK40-0174]|uniref:tyrosine-type recombinase/integrase n=1 Tax=Hydrogenophaga sp. 5NK40-0174 TaxID=3127649 RepID=UPI003107039E
MQMTETAIRKMAPPAKSALVSDPATKGLYLRCYPSGRKTWLYRTRKLGVAPLPLARGAVRSDKPKSAWRTQNLGEWPRVSLAEARDVATTLARRGVPEAITFGALLREWFDSREYKVSKNILVYVGKGETWLGRVKLTQLTTRDMVDRLKQYADEHPVAANRCLAVWKMALDYAVERGHLEANPLARTKARTVGGTEKPRQRVLTDDEIRWVLRLEHHYGPLLRALLATGLRISEGQAAMQQHVQGDTWHIPENKSARPHWVPVVPFVREQFGNHDGHLFCVYSPTAVQAWLKRNGPGFTPHDLRRTFATRVAAFAPPYVVEKCLNHQMQGVMAVYNHHDYASERRAAAVAWEAELRRINA